VRKRLAVRQQLVGVITSPGDLNLAVRMRSPPDLFELRLDCLLPIVVHLEKKLRRLRAPLIITARSPHEGGAHSLSVRERRDLLIRFLPYAQYVDIELRSATGLSSVLRLAQEKKLKQIISYHDFKSTPALRVLLNKARAAKAHGANIFKIATRTDTPVDLTRLLNLMMNDNISVRISSMGIGELGAISRVLLARAGSALVYGSVGTRANVEGQLSLAKLQELGIPPRG
jgi:3-dehydroquinate dehydratase I